MTSLFGCCDRCLVMVVWLVLQIKVKEEKRLASTVHTIDKEVSVVPRGAFIKSPHGLVQTNCSFEGKATFQSYS